MSGNSDRICVLVKGQIGIPPPPLREACRSKQHSHMSRVKVEALVAEGKMEWLEDERQAARVNPRWWPAPVKASLVQGGLCNGDGSPTGPHPGGPPR
jgi:hypothetical protein